MARVNLRVPFSEKDKAKAMGARWDANARVWCECYGSCVPTCRDALHRDSGLREPSAHMARVSAADSCDAQTGVAAVRRQARTLFQALYPYSSRGCRPPNHHGFATGAEFAILGNARVPQIAPIDALYTSTPTQRATEGRQCPSDFPSIARRRDIQSSPLNAC
jgi:hypothetical protein